MLHPLKSSSLVSFVPFRVEAGPRMRVALEWAFFATCIFLTAATIWWKTRTTGPISLAILTALLWQWRVTDRATAVRRLSILLLCFVAAYILRNYSHSLLAHRGGRFTLISGMVLTTFLSLPPVLVRLRQKLEGLLQTQPDHWRAYVTAFFTVTVPFVALQMNTTDQVWTGDTIPVVPAAVQLCTDGSRELSDYLPGHGYFRWDVCGTGKTYFVRHVPGAEGVYSTYPAGMEPFAMPLVLVAWATGFDLTSDVVLFWIEKISAATLAGFSLGLFFLTGLRMGSPLAAWIVTLMLATGSVFASTLGMLLWQQGGIIFWSLLAIYLEFRSAGRPGKAATLLQGIACGMMLACRPSAVTFLIPFGLWILFRDWRRGFLVPAIAVLTFAPWAWMYYSLYHNPFGPAMGFLNEQWFPGEFILGVLFSPGRGLFVYQPVLLLLAFLAWRDARSTGTHPLPAGWAFFVIATCIFHLLLTASWPIWWGGFCYGSRLVAEVVPIMALATIRPVTWLLQTRHGLAILGVVGILGAGIHAPCLYTDAWLWNAIPISADAHPERLWNWTSPPFLYGLVPPR